MKLSISLKLFLSVLLVFIFLILSVLILNSTVLEQYYRNQKEQSLIKLYSQSVEFYSQSNSDDSTDIITEFQKVDSTKNIEIAVCDLDNNVIFSSSNNFLRNGLFGPPMENGSSPSLYQIYMDLTEDGPYMIQLLTDKRIGSDFLTLYGVLSEGQLIFFRTPLESIKESAIVSNQFLLIVGTACTIIASIIVYFVSKAFTKPIQELNEIATRMSNLDFSKKYNVRSDDELGNLGKSINKLSDSLEKTINDLKETNMELEKDIEETSKISEMRSQFVSDVSHELKTPIALIQGYAEGLNEGIVTDEESKKYYIEVILDEANKMSNLTKDLLDLSRLEYGNEALRLEDFCINDLVNDVFRKNELIFNEKNIHSSIHSDNTYNVFADHGRIEQVITNYLSNAIKNIDDKKEIKCEIKKTENGKIKVGIVNSGKPIPEEEIPRLWTRFYKADTSRDRSVGGTGIGLSLVKAIMNLHHNSFGVKNLQNGVEFWFELDEKK
jgi:signal transduction histidine kinase